MSSICTPIKLTGSKAFAAPNAPHHWTHSFSKALQWSSWQRYVSSAVGNAVGFNPILDPSGAGGPAIEYGMYRTLHEAPDWLAGPSPGEVAVRDIKGTVSVEFYNQHKDALERLFNRSDMPKFEML